MRIFLNKKGKRGQIFPMRAGDAKQKINLPWPNHLFCTVPCPFPSDLEAVLKEGIGTEQFKLHIVITKAHVKFEQDWLKIF